MTKTVADPTKRAKPKCIKGTACGYSCIAAKYTCSDKVLKRDANALLAAARAADTDWRQPPYSVSTTGRSSVSAVAAAWYGDSAKAFAEELKSSMQELDDDTAYSLGKSYLSTARALDSLARASLMESEEDAELAKAEIAEVTTELFAKHAASAKLKPKKDSEFYRGELRSEAVAWAKSQGFEPGGVNGFTADATAAHDLAHPATHRLTGLDSASIFRDFGEMLDSSDKPSLLAEETLVNIVEHLAMGDTPEASIQNGIRLAKVLSRTQSERAQAYVRSNAFARAVIGITYDRIMKNSEYASIMPVVRDSTFISGTVTASGTDFTNSASGG